MSLMSSTEARHKAQELRNLATNESSASVRYELKRAAEQFDLLATQLEEIEKRR